MTCDQLKQIVLGRYPQAESIIDSVLEPYRTRDKKAVERGQSPYLFHPRDVLWLERKVMRRLR